MAGEVGIGARTLSRETGTAKTALLRNAAREGCFLISRTGMAAKVKLPRKIHIDHAGFRC